MSDIIVSIIGLVGSIIVAIFGFIGVVITNKKSNKELEQKLVTAQAVTDTKIEELTREVREHNNFARRMPVVENDIQHLLNDERHLQNEINHLKTFHEGR